MVQRVNSPGFSYDWRQHHEAGPQLQQQQQPAPLSLADAVYTIGDYAVSRHTRYVSDRDLLDIAANEHGQYPLELQEAARLRFDYDQDFDLIRKQLLAQEQRPRSRLFQYCYRHQDLLSMSGRAHGAGRRVVQGVLAAGFGVLEGLMLHGSKSMPDAGQYRQALEDMAQDICGRGKSHMSFERLMVLRRRGNKFADVLVRDLKRLHRLFNEKAPRNKAFSAQELMQHAQRLVEQEQGRATAAAAAGAAPAAAPPPVFAVPRPEPAQSTGPAPVIEEVDDTEQESDLEARREEYAKQELLRQQRLEQARQHDALQDQDVRRQEQHAADIRHADQHRQEIVDDRLRQERLRDDQLRQDQQHQDRLREQDLRGR